VPRPTCVPSFILIHPIVWPQYTNVIDRTGQDKETDRQTDRTDRQRSDSIGRAVLQTVAQKPSAHNWIVNIYSVMTVIISISPCEITSCCRAIRLRSCGRTDRFITGRYHRTSTTTSRVVMNECSLYKPRHAPAVYVINHLKMTPVIEIVQDVSDVTVKSLSRGKSAEVEFITACKIRAHLWKCSYSLINSPYSLLKSRCVRLSVIHWKHPNAPSIVNRRLLRAHDVLSPHHYRLEQVQHEL